MKRRISELCTEFSKNLNENVTKEAFSREELDGMAESWLSSLEKADDTDKVHAGKLYVTLKYPDVVPLMQHCRVPETRKRMDFLKGAMCEEENVPLFDEVLELRKEVRRERRSSILKAERRKGQSGRVRFLGRGENEGRKERQWSGITKNRLYSGRGESPYESGEQYSTKISKRERTIDDKMKGKGGNWVRWNVENEDKHHVRRLCLVQEWNCLDGGRNALSKELTCARERKAYLVTCCMFLYFCCRWCPERWLRCLALRRLRTMRWRSAWQRKRRRYLTSWGC